MIQPLLRPGATRSAADHLAFSIDGISPLAKGVLAVSGWVVNSKLPVIDVQIGASAGCLVQAELTAHPDVEARYPHLPKANVRGFRAELPIQVLKDKDSLFAVITSADGTSEVLTAPIPSGLPHSRHRKDPFIEVLSSPETPPSFSSLREKISSLTQSKNSLAAALRDASLPSVDSYNRLDTFYRGAARAAVEDAKKRATKEGVSTSLFQAPRYEGLGDNEPADASTLSICIVTLDLTGPIYNGGMGTFHSSLAEVLRDAGHQVTILYEQGDYCEHRDIAHWIRLYKQRGITLVPLRHSQTELHASLPLQRSYHVYQWLKQRHFDWIHFHEMYGLGYYSILARRHHVAFQNTTICVGIHSPTTWHMKYNRQFLTQPALLEIDYMERESVALADVAFSPSRNLLNTLHAEGWSFPEKSYVLPQPLRTRDISPRAQASETEVAVEELVFFGRLETRKGLVLFCDALDLLSQEVSRALRISFIGKIQTVGNSTSEHYITERAKRWNFEVEVYGDHDRDAALRHLQRPGILAVLPSLEDNGPYTVYECLAAGVPLVTTRVGGIPEIIASEDHDAAIVDPCPRRLADRLRSLLISGVRNVRPQVSFERSRKLWQDFHVERHRQVTPPPPRTTEDSVSVLVLIRSDEADLAPLFKLLASESECAEVLLLECKSGLLDSPKISAALTQAAHVPPSLNLIPYDASQGFAKAFADLRTPHVLLLDQNVLPAAGSLAILKQAMTASDSAFAASFVQLCTEHGGAVTSEKLFLGNSPAATILRNNVGSSGAMFRTEALLSFAALSELSSNTDIFWEVFSTLQTVGERGTLVPEALFSEKFSSCAVNEHNSASSFRRALKPVLKANPTWASPLFSFAQGMGWMFTSRSFTEPALRQDTRYIAERFSCAESSLLKAVPENRFVQLKRLRDIKLHRGSERLSCTPQGPFPQLLLEPFSIPLRGSPLYIHLELYCLKAGVLKVSFTHEESGGTGRTEYKQIQLKEGRNRVWLDVDIQDLTEPIVLDLSPEGERYEIIAFEIRHSPYSANTDTQRREEHRGVLREASDKVHEEPSSAIFIEPEITVLLTNLSSFESFSAAARTNAPYWGEKREVITFLTDPSDIVKLQELRAELGFSLRWIDPLQDKSLSASLKALFSAARSPLCFLHDSSLQYCGDVPARLLSRARSEGTKVIEGSPLLFAPRKILKLGESIAASGPTDVQGGIFLTRDRGLALTEIPGLSVATASSSGSITSLYALLGQINMECILCPEALLVEFEAEPAVDNSRPHRNANSGSLSEDDLTLLTFMHRRIARLYRCCDV